MMRAGSEEDVRLVRRIGDLELELQRDGVPVRRRLAGAARAAMARAAAVIDMVVIASAAGGGGRLGKCESQPNTATLPSVKLFQRHCGARGSRRSGDHWQRPVLLVTRPPP